MTESVAQATRATVYVMVGLPGSGKTTRARQLEVRHRALRLTPDEWMMPLFGEPEADGKRDVLEGRFVWLAMRALRLGVNVILDFGVWSRQERSALRWLAAREGADCQLVYLAVDEVEQRRRIRDRCAADPATTVDVRADELERFRQLFDVPDDDELNASAIDDPPARYPTWGSWAAERWPTSLAS